MTIPQLPRLCDLMTPAVMALVAARPKAQLQFAAGVYGDVHAGWAAQATVWRNYIAAECVAGRLPLAEGEQLSELAGSEYWSDPDRTAQAAVGEVQLFRSFTNTNSARVGLFSTGTIPQGNRFALTANDAAKPPLQAAQFTSSEPVYVGPDDNATINNGDGTFTHEQVVTIPVDATTSGMQANIPVVVGGANAQGSIVDALFDTTFVLTHINAAGGSTGVDDPWLRIIAASELAGFFGPNNAALIAGAMEVPRVRHMAVALDIDDAIALVFVADAAWAVSSRLATLVTQNIAQNWQGFGCRFLVRSTFNQLIGVVATVVVDSAQSLTAQADIAANIRTALRSYFDDRPDWYTWRNRSVGSTIAHADKRIVTCTSFSVNDQNDNALAEPPPKLDPTSGFATHYYLLDNAVRLTFVAPS